MSRLTDLLREAKKLDAKLGDALEEEVRHLQQRRAFGLNFERHTPEAVELHGRPVRVGDKVRMLPPRGQTNSSDNRLWIVTGGATVDGIKRADLRDPQTGEVANHPVDDLVVVAEHTDVIYPGLVSTGRVERGDDKPFHTVINGENLHALKTLLYTHTGKIDCIYIDPPYNTGNDDWIYSDKYITSDDMYRHSKWLAFMERRLKLARELLKEDGVIMVAIGDEEHHRLRLLLDQVFHEANFISDVVWQGVRKNDSRYVSNSADYMLIYAKDESALARNGVRWRDEKIGVREVLEVGRSAWESAGHDAVEATRLLKAWFKSNRGRFTASLTNYQQIDSKGRIYYGDNIASPNPRPNLQYDVLHPVTHLPCRRHPNGWRYSAETMEKLIADDRILFGNDHTTLPYFKRFLADQLDEVPLSTFEQPRRSAGQYVDSLIGRKRFPNPKDHRVLMRWIRIAAGPSAVILDFFGGSGSTLEAVARLNALDGGTRRCILVTNNEVSLKDAAELRKAGYRPDDPKWEAKGVHDYVAMPRIVAITTGDRPDGSRFGDLVDANVDFLRLTYEAPLAVSTNHAFSRIAPLLWLRAGSRGRRIESLPTGWDVAEVYGVIERLDKLDDFVAALAAQPAASVAFIVTDDDRRFQSALAQLPDGVEPVRLYESYLRNFQIDAVRSTR